MANTLSNFAVYTLNPDDIVDQVGDDQRLLPDLFSKGGGMKRFITDRHEQFRAGHTKVSGDQGFATYFWYDEFWVVRRGRGRVIATDRATGQSVAHELGPDDTVFIGRGCHISGEAIGDEPWVFFYVAIPASRKDAAWLAHMTQDDIADVRTRNEFNV